MSDPPAPAPDHDYPARLQALLARPSATPGLPALRETVRAVQKVARPERSAGPRAVSDELVQDVALSNRLLRLVSVVFSRGAPGAQVDSLARAATMLSSQGVGRLGAALRLLERVPAAWQGTQVQARFARALLAGLLAHALHPSAKEAETVFLAGLLQDLGGLLLWLHFPHEARSLQGQAAEAARAEHGQARDDTSRRARLAELEAVHARRHHGLSPVQLGLEVARLWDWPAELLPLLQPMAPQEFLQRPASATEHLRRVASLANLLADLIVETSPQELAGALEAFQGRWKSFLGDDPKPLQALLVRVEQQWADLAGALHLADAGAGTRMRALRAGESAALAAPAQGAWPVLSAAGLAQRLQRLPEGGVGAGPQAAPAGEGADPTAARAGAELARGARQLAQALEEGGSAALALQGLADVLVRALGAQRVIVCLRDPAGAALQGRLGAGAGLPAPLSRFRVELGAAQDLFGLACSRRLDTFVEDAHKAAIWTRLPQWFRVQVHARCLLLLPLAGDKGCLGLVYVDHAEPAGLPLPGDLLRQVQALRDQVQAALVRRAQPAAVQPDTA